MFKWFKDFIERLAEENEKEYKGKKLDCCNMNRQDMIQNNKNKNGENNNNK